MLGLLNGRLTLRLFRTLNRQGEARNIVVFGSGVVGSAVANVLHNQGACLVGDYATPWQNHRLMNSQLESLESELFTANEVVSWVWAAGAVGFGADRGATQQELASFELFLDFAKSALEGYKNVRQSIHLVSSAGGLFESQRIVTSRAPVRPIRLYGKLKLIQETRASDTFGAESTTVYRLSSVYGRIHTARRQGLISTIISNTLKHRVTKVFGTLDTLRDYIWEDDVGTFIGMSVLDDQASDGGVCLLASARPYSIRQVRHVVEKMTGCRAYIHCVEAKNAAHMSFSATAIARGFLSTPLETNVRRIIRDYGSGRL